MSKIIPVLFVFIAMFLKILTKLFCQLDYLTRVLDNNSDSMSIIEDICVRYQYKGINTNIDNKGNIV
jgi:hypothetical protein